MDHTVIKYKENHIEQIPNKKSVENYYGIALLIELVRTNDLRKCFVVLCN